MTLIFKQPINLGKDAQSDVESRWANLACECTHACACVRYHTEQFSSWQIICEIGDVENRFSNAVIEVLCLLLANP